MKVVAEGIDSGWDGFDEAAGLLSRSYPKGSVAMSAEFLRWSLTGWTSVVSPGVVVTARTEGSMRGFAGASPRLLAIDGVSLRTFIVSFVAVAPEARGHHLAERLYAHLLEQLTASDPKTTVLTFAQAGSPGATLIERCYPRAGWHGRELQSMAPWGILRQRIQTDGGDSIPHCEGRVLSVADSELARSCMENDPNTAAITADGMRVNLIDTLEGSPVGSIDSLPSPFSMVQLNQALNLGADRLGTTIERIIVPFLPAGTHASAPSIGLRRVPGPVFRAWVWTTAPGHAVFQATHTTVPIT